MVDVATHALFHPDKALTLESLNSDRSRKEELPPQANPYQDELYYYARPPPPPVQTNTVVPKEDSGQDLISPNEKKQKVKVLHKLTDDQALLANSVIWGFALNEKQWV